jgi:hypothetical protein
VSALGVKPKILSTKKKGLDASNDRGLTERSGEVFSLDILSHRRSGEVFSLDILSHRMSETVAIALNYVKPARTALLPRFGT